KPKPKPKTTLTLPLKIGMTGIIGEAGEVRPGGSFWVVKVKEITDEKHAVLTIEWHESGVSDDITVLATIPTEGMVDKEVFESKEKFKVTRTAKYRSQTVFVLEPVNVSLFAQMRSQCHRR